MSATTLATGRPPWRLHSGAPRAQGGPCLSSAPAAGASGCRAGGGCRAEVVRGLGGVALAVGVGLLTATDASLAFDVPDHLEGCAPKTSCVSTSARNSPAQYLPPWDYAGVPREQAFAKLEAAISRRGGQVTERQAQRYIRAQIPFGKEVDTVEFLFIEGDDIIVFRDSSGINLPDPPGCFTFGCINGPRNRQHMAELAEALDFLSYETDEDKKWVPLLLH